MAELPGRLPSGRLWQHGLPGTASAAEQAFRRLGDDLLPGLDLKHDGAAIAADNSEGAVVQRLERRHSAAADPDQAGREELGWQLAGQVKTGAGIVPGGISRGI